MATTKQIAANQKNAQRSTGPRTARGKDQSRLNALKHGMRADAFEVLPNEDPVAFQDCLDRWFDDEQPATEAQAQLVRRAAVLSWKLDRAERYESSILSERVREAEEKAESARLDRLHQADRQLLPAVLAYHRSGPDGLDLDVVRAEVEASAEGCRWLIARWATLLRQAQRNRAWDENEEFHATRLLGISTIDKVRYMMILDVVVANRVIAKPDVPVTPQTWFDGIGNSYSRSDVMGACMRKPANRDDARSILIRTAGDEIARLEEVLAKRLRDGDLGAAEVKRAGRKAWFDPSPEGERLRRHQSAMHRELIRTLEALAKLRAEEARRQEEAEAALAEAIDDAIEPNPAVETISEGQNGAIEPNSDEVPPNVGTANDAIEPNSTVPQKVSFASEAIGSASPGHPAGPSPKDSGGSR